VMTGSSARTPFSFPFPSSGLVDVQAWESQGCATCGIFPPPFPPPPFLFFSITPPPHPQALVTGCRTIPEKQAGYGTYPFFFLFPFSFFLSNG